MFIPLSVSDSKTSTLFRYRCCAFKKLFSSLSRDTKCWFRRSMNQSTISSAIPVYGCFATPCNSLSGWSKLDRPAGTGRPKADFQWGFSLRNVVWLAFWRLNLTPHNLKISSCGILFCDDNLSKNHSQLLEYSQTFQIASRYAPTVVIFSVTYLLITYLPTWWISARDVSHWKPAFGRE